MRKQDVRKRIRRPAPIRRAVPAAHAAPETPAELPRRTVVFIGAECYPFVKTGGLGDVMYALPRALTALGCEVRVLLPCYHCIPESFRSAMRDRGEFMLPLCADGREFSVGLRELERGGVVYDFIVNEEFFAQGKPYTDLARDIPRYCFFSKAALAALNFLELVPDVLHCHDWQTSLVPVYLRTDFAQTPVGKAKSMLTIHNLRFQGIHNLPTVLYWSGLPYMLADYRLLKQGSADGNMFKCGLAYADCITTVSPSYAWEMQTEAYGEGLDAHLRYHAWKMHGIVNGIDTAQWNSETDTLLCAPYGAADAVEKKKRNKRALQERLGLETDGDKLVLGLISRLTDQKGLELLRDILPELLDGRTQLVLLGTGEAEYEECFRRFAQENSQAVSASIVYDEELAHQIYAGADALLVPSLFEPCGLTQLIAMHYGTVPIVRETGGLKDTVQPYNAVDGSGNGFSFDRPEAALLLDAIRRAEKLYFDERARWDALVTRDMEKDVSWENSARQYRELYLRLCPES